MNSPLKTLPLALTLAITGCTSERETFFAMDTVVELIAVGADDRTERAALTGAGEAIEEVEGWADSRNPSAEIYRLNQLSGRGPVTVSARLAITLKTALEVAAESGGAFDPTVFHLLQAYGFGEEDQAVPDAEKLLSLLEFVDYRRVKLEGNTVEMPPGFALDLGGIAKGYAVDEALTAMQSAGAVGGLVNIGGDIAVFGERPDGDPWRIGIQHPRAPGEIFAVLTLENEAVATSGDYERYFIEGGVRYHHLLDPKTGLPARGFVSVTVTAPNCTLADAYATAVFVLGRDEGAELLERKEYLEGLLIYHEEDGSLGFTITPGLAEKAEVVNDNID